MVVLDIESGGGDKNYSSNKKRQLPVTPHPPPSIKPHPPRKATRRPQTAGDFRSRRYRQRSVEEPVEFVNTVHHGTDDVEEKLESRLDSKQPGHLIDINGQHQEMDSFKDIIPIGYNPEHNEKKTFKK